MGYCYDIALLIANESKQIIIDELKNASVESQEFFKDRCDHSMTDPETGDILYTWIYTKLSMELEDFIDELISLIEEDSFRFIKMGEESGDIEIQGYHHNKSFDLDWVRELRFNVVEEHTQITNQLNT